ncbi:histone deacetylase complex protein, partial [Coprinopsis sp. MPI-PUGE-AT-0042]
IRAFVKVGVFHRLNVFEDGALPTADEHQVYTSKDATLRELLTTLRDASSPSSLAFAELKHPLARFLFKALYAGHKSSRSTFKYTTKELGMVYSRDILGEPGSFSLSTGATTAPRLLQDEEQASSALPLDADDTANGNGAEKAGRDHDKTLEDIRFIPGDYMLISIILPKSALATPATAAGGASTAELSIKGANATQAGGGAGSVGWKNAMRDVGREHKETGRGANSSNWRAGSDPLTFVSSRGGRGRGARGGHGGQDVSPPIRRGARGDTPPRRGGRGDSPPRRGGRDDSPRRSRSPVPRRGGRARSNRSLSRSRSRSRSPGRRRRYD